MTNRIAAWIVAHLSEPVSSQDDSRDISGYHGGRSSDYTPGIEDGANYGMPVLLPEVLRERLVDAGKLEAFLQEANETFRFQFDTPQRSAADLPVQPTTEDPLREWTWSTRQQVLSNCHSVYERNPLANAIVQYTADFSRGGGFNLKCRNSEVQQILEDFIDNPDNAIREFERQAFIDLQLDGEIMLRIFTGSGATKGQIVAVPLRPWECQWIQTELGFFRRPEIYRFQFRLQTGDSPMTQQTKLEDVPADEVLHVAINRHGYELRGRPDLYRLLPWLRAHREYLENRARQNHWRNALLWFVKVIGGNAAQVAAVRARWGRPPQPGSVAIEGGNVEVSPMVNTAGGASEMEDGRQMKLMVILGARMAEYMLGDGQNANLASATAQQLPSLTKFEAFQVLMIEQCWTPLFRRVLETAIDAGLIDEIVEEQDSDGDTLYKPAPKTSKPAYPPGSPMTNQSQVIPPLEKPKGEKRMVDTCKAFTVSYAPIGKDKDPLKEAQALAVAEDRKWISTEKAATDFGVDYDIEQKKIAREEEEAAAEQMEKQAAGTAPLTPDQLMANDGLAPKGMTAVPPGQPQPGQQSSQAMATATPTA